MQFLSIDNVIREIMTCFVDINNKSSSSTYMIYMLRIKQYLKGISILLVIYLAFLISVYIIHPDLLEIIYNHIFIGVIIFIISYFNCYIHNSNIKIGFIALLFLSYIYGYSPVIKHYFVNDNMSLTSFTILYMVFILFIYPIYFIYKKTSEFERISFIFQIGSDKEYSDDIDPYETVHKLYARMEIEKLFSKNKFFVKNSNNVNNLTVLYEVFNNKFDEMDNSQEFINILLKYFYIDENNTVQVKKI